MNKKQGFIIHLVIIIVALVVLDYYTGGVIKSFFWSPPVIAFLSKVWSFIMYIWTNYLFVPLSEFWHKVITGIFWATLVEFFSKIRGN